MKTNETKSLTLFTIGGCTSCERVVNELSKKDHEAIIAHYNLKVVNLEKLSAKKRTALHVKSVPSYVITAGKNNTVLSENKQAVNAKDLVNALYAVADKST